MTKAQLQPILQSCRVAANDCLTLAERGKALGLSPTAIAASYDHCKGYIVNIRRVNGLIAQAKRGGGGAVIMDVKVTPNKF